MAANQIDLETSHDQMAAGVSGGVKAHIDGGGR